MILQQKPQGFSTEWTDYLTLLQLNGSGREELYLPLIRGKTRSRSGQNRSPLMFVGSSGCSVGFWLGWVEPDSVWLTRRWEDFSDPLLRELIRHPKWSPICARESCWTWAWLLCWLRPQHLRVEMENNLLRKTASPLWDEHPDVAADPLCWCLLDSRIDKKNLQTEDRSICRSTSVLGLLLPVLSKERWSTLQSMEPRVIQLIERVDVKIRAEIEEGSAFSLYPRERSSQPLTILFNARICNSTSPPLKRHTATCRIVGHKPTLRRKTACDAFNWWTLCMKWAHHLLWLMANGTAHCHLHVIKEIGLHLDWTERPSVGPNG